MWIAARVLFADLHRHLPCAWRWTWITRQWPWSRGVQCGRARKRCHQDKLGLQAHLALSYGFQDQIHRRRRRRVHTERMRITTLSGCRNGLPVSRQRHQAVHLRLMLEASAMAYNLLLLLRRRSVLTLFLFLQANERECLSTSAPSARLLSFYGNRFRACHRAEHRAAHIAVRVGTAQGVE